MFSKIDSFFLFYFQRVTGALNSIKIATVYVRFVNVIFLHASCITIVMAVYGMEKQVMSIVYTLIFIVVIPTLIFQIVPLVEVLDGGDGKEDLHQVIGFKAFMLTINWLRPWLVFLFAGVIVVSVLYVNITWFWLSLIIFMYLESCD